MDRPSHPWISVSLSHLYTALLLPTHHCMLFPQHLPSLWTCLPGIPFGLFEKSKRGSGRKSGCDEHCLASQVQGESHRSLESAWDLSHSIELMLSASPPPSPHCLGIKHHLTYIRKISATLKCAAIRNWLLSSPQERLFKLEVNHIYTHTRVHCGDVHRDPCIHTYIQRCLYHTHTCGGADQAHTHTHPILSSWH